MIKPFNITILTPVAKTYTVRQIFIDNRIEIYDVIAKNKIITIQSNRPLFRSKGLKHHKPTWKVTTGQLHNVDFLQKIYTAVMKEVDK